MKKIASLGGHRAIETEDYNFHDDDGILFMLAKGQHTTHFCTAVFALRYIAGFQGRIAVVTLDNKAKTFVEKMMVDPNFSVEHYHKKLKLEGGGKGRYYNLKTRMLEVTPFEGRTLFLDADTMVVKDGYQRMLPPNKHTPEVMFTQFCDWVTCGKIMRDRIKPWAKIEGCENAHALMANSYPAINTGVMGFSHLSKKFFKKWIEVCRRRISFICDEISAQIIFPSFPHRVRYQEQNASPLHITIAQDDVITWHGHGWKFVRTEYGRKVYIPVVLEAAKHNFGKINEWMPDVDNMLTQLLFFGKHQDESEKWNEIYQTVIS